MPANDTLQSALVLNNGSCVPDGEGEGEDGLNDGSIYFDRLNFFNCHKNYVLWCAFFVQALVDDAAQEAEGHRGVHWGVHWGVTTGDGGPTTISTVFKSLDYV